MQNLEIATRLLKDFYNRHKSVIDVLAKEDEMFRAVKEIAETDNGSIQNDGGRRNQLVNLHR